MNSFILTTYHSPKYFCDREEETKQLISAIDNNRNTTLISKRRMGKTGLLKHLEYIYKSDKQRNFIYFYIMTTSSIADFVKLFANSLFSSERTKLEALDKTFSKIFSSFKPSFSVNSITGETKLNIELSDAYDSENSLNAIFTYLSSRKSEIIIAIDEFQQIVNYGEENFEAMLRSYIQHLNNTVFIFSGSSKEILNTMFTNKHRPFYLSSDIMFLSNILKSNYNSLIEQKFEENGVTINKDCIDYLLDLVEIHTYYVQLLCNRLYAEKQGEIS